MYNIYFILLLYHAHTYYLLTATTCFCHPKTLRRHDTRPPCQGLRLCSSSVTRSGALMKTVLDDAVACRGNGRVFLQVGPRFLHRESRGGLTNMEPEKCGVFPLEVWEIPAVSKPPFFQVRTVSFRECFIWILIVKIKAAHHCLMIIFRKNNWRRQIIRRGYSSFYCPTRVFGKYFAFFKKWLL